VLPATIDELASALDLSRAQLTYWAYVAKRPQKYTSFKLSKRSGGTRPISAPKSQLKTIQRRLLALLETHYRPRACAHGFTSGRSILSNAEKHVGKAYTLNIDLEEFFPSINFGRVRGALMAKPFGLPRAVATVVAQLACFENHLPQGAPTSPLLSNLVCGRLDSNLTSLCRSLRCDYTRYADDITISTNRRVFPSDLAVAINPPYGTGAEVGLALRAIIESNGFRVNQGKVRLTSQRNSQQVTGLVCNQFANVPRTYVREVRAMIHAWKKYGLVAAETEFRAKHARLRAPTRPEPMFPLVVRGKLEFLAMVRGRDNPQYIGLAKQVRELAPELFPYPLDRHEIVDGAVWVLESDSTGQQGTAFMLKDVGLVTCDHVLASDTVAFQVGTPSLRYPVSVKARDKHIDLAILEIDVTNAPYLLRGDPARLERHDELMLVGFPGYGPGMHHAYRAKGQVTMTKVKSSILYIVPNIAIAKGNSGGPVLNADYRVVGVATYGSATLKAGVVAAADEPAAIFIDYIDRL
jgi:RNA-directed DNA polymerase